MPLVCPDCMTEVDPALAAACPNCGRLFSSCPNDETVGYTEGPPERSPIPPMFGRYRVIGKLGAGGFGVVYRAFDEELLRDVAVKVPHAHRLGSQQAVETYLAEARNLASVDHPGIVPVYDVGQTPDGRCYLVSKFIDGGNLSERMRLSPLSHIQSARIVLHVASALHHAHQRGLIHRDVKPSNILLDRAENPYLTDFGLALREEDAARAGNIAGTPAYMSPEQLRRETHRIDARTDVYSLGAVLYELLAGSWPLHGKTVGQLREQIMHFEVPALRAVDAAIPTAIERICHKALAKRSADRFSTAIDLAEDLEQCLPALEAAVPATARRAAPDCGAGASVPVSAAGATSMPVPGMSDARRPSGTGTGSTVGAVGSTSLGLEAPLRIVPKGLRSFDPEDADFFLELLPGPFDREGLPESVRFWKTRIEQTDADKTFSVGLIYGPSGCGKSSLVKAGLLPRLDEHVTPVYLEATPEGTETRLLAALRKRVALLPDDLTLKDTLAAIRRGLGAPAGRKVVLVLDQFEQWLHAQRDREAPELLRALRQCDGGRLQCVVLVRDDFWMAITRFMHALEVKLVEGHNSAGVDLFSPQHARKVLAAFGRAFGCLPPTDEALGSDHKGFLRDAVKGLSRDGKIISVQLALFADMVKNKPWSPATLKEVGGTEGIGLTFLEETFSAAHAPPQHRVHQRAARQVLRALLPERGSDIKGQMHARDELLARSGYANRPGDFDELINILDAELRLVTPADPEAVLGDEDDDTQAGAARAPLGGKYYQLTHDYLVPSVRRWLVHKQRQTRRGRTELLLEERSATWNARPQRRYLPSWWQWHRIKLLTNKRDWSVPQVRMMRAAAWYHQTRTVAMAVLLVLLGWGGLEGFGYLKAQKLRDQVLYVKTADLPGIIPQLMPYRRWANPLLRTALVDAAPNTREQLNARLALLPVDPSQADALYGRLLECDLEVFFVLRNALFEYRSTLSDRLWQLLDNVSADAEHRLRAAMLLARYNPPQNKEFTGRWGQHAEFLAEQLHHAVVTEPARYNALTGALTPVRSLLLDPLHAICRDTRLSDSDRSIGVNLVLEYATDRPDLLADVLLAEGDTARSVRIIDRLASTPTEAIGLLEPELAKRQEDLEPQWNDPPGTFPPPDPALVQKIESATGMVADHFAFCQTMALEDFITVADGLRGAGYRPIRFRPYRGDADVRVAAVWTRDERPWSIDHGLTQEEVRTQISGDRMKDDLLHDLAAYYDDAGELRYTATWSTREPDDPEAIAFAGEEGQQWQSFINNDASGFSFITNHLLATQSGSLYFTFVFWKTSQVDRSWINRSPKAYAEQLRDDYGDRLLVDANVTVESTISPAEARQAQYVARVANAEQALRADPDELRNWYDRGYQNFCAGNDADAIRDFTHYLENGGADDKEQWRPEHSHTWRIAAAARQGVAKRELDEYVRQADAFHDNDRSFALFHRALASAYGPGVRQALDEFEQHVADLEDDVWRHFSLVRAYAFASAALRPSDPAQSQLYADRAIAHLEKTVGTDVRHVFWVRTYPLTDSLRDDPRFRQIELKVELDNIEEVRLARQGDVKRAKASLQTYLNGSANLQQKVRRAAMVAAFLGDDEAGIGQLEQELAERPNHQALRFNAAFAYSLASYAVAGEHPDRAARYADRAVELLSEWAHAGSFTAIGDRLQRMLTNWHCHPIREHPGFKSLIAELDRSYTGVFQRNVDFESQELRDSDLANHLKRCRELAALGYRPVAADSAWIRTAAAEGKGQWDAVSVWHKPRVTEEQRDALARRQATAAVALARLGSTEKVWPLLKDSPEPRLRTFVIHQLGPLGTGAAALAARLDDEPDAAVRRALIVALGEYDDEALASADREPLVEQLVQMYRNDSDPGVHSAAEWLLRKWGYADELVNSGTELATTQPETGRRWFVTPAGDTMVVIDGPVEFAMGSPLREPDRDGDETQHRRRIGRTFAIATKEVTVEQFRRFLRANPDIEHSHRRSHSPELDCPVGTVTWYQIAQYCRWLSEREGLPESEMCYPPIDEIKPGMRLKPFYLTRSGYRLPTEAEWEYACRAGTTTARYYGYSDALAPKYAWFKEVAENRSWPVGTLIPNRFGLFDMYGNALELCHEHLHYPNDEAVEAVDDAVPTAYERPPVRLSLRGGSALHEESLLRSADRLNYGTSGLTTGQRHIGFRIARTLPPDDVLAARAHAAAASRLLESGDTGKVEQSIETAEAAYDKLLATQSDKEAFSWELAELHLDHMSRWTLLKPSQLTSSGGATLELQSDGSVLASGLNPDDDSYTVVAHTDLSGIRAIRLEALPDSSHPNGGIGRFPSNGNFHLSEFSLALRPQESEGNDTPVSIRRAFADYALADFDIERSLDGNQVTFWDPVPFQRLPHVAVFETAQPVGGSDGVTLVIKLDFTTMRWDQHNLGRFRLWVSNDPATVEAERIRMNLAAPEARLAAASYLAGNAQRAVDCLTRKPTGAIQPIVIEAEHFDAIEAPWRVYSDPLASAGRYLMAPNGTGRGTGTDKLLHYRIRLPDAGQYRIVARARGPNGTDDSLWLSIDGGTPVLWGINGARSDWDWVEHPDRFTLSAGEHTLQVGVREDGTRLDKIVLTADASFDPRRTDFASTVYDPLLMSLACFRLDRLDEARQHLEESLDWMGAHLTDATMQQFAGEALAACVAREPDSATWLRRRAAIAAALGGQREEAIAAYTKLAQAEPANPEWALRLRQLQPDVAAFWNFDFGYEDWTAANECRLSLAEGILRVESTGTDPFITVATAAPSGWFELALRVRLGTPAPSQLFWSTRSGLDVAESRSVHTTLQGSADAWSERTIYFHSTEPLTFLRLDLGNRPDAKVEIDAITLRHLGDEPEQALAALTTIIEEEPQNPDALLRRAALYDALGRRNESYEDYAKALAASAPSPALLAAVENSVAQRPLVATSEQEPVQWRYTLTDPGEGWQGVAFADEHWMAGPGPFGDWHTFATRWDTSDIWLRREFELEELLANPNLFVRVLVDERAQVYVNGVLAAEGTWVGTKYQRLDCTAEAAATLRAGKNVLAVHCSNEVGAALIDAGLYWDDREAWLAVLNKALAFAPDRAELHIARGDLYTRAQAWTKAAEDYSRAITDQTQDAELIAKRAEAYYQLRQWEPAVADWTRALELTPDVIDYLRKRAICYRNLRQRAKSRADWTALMKLRPGNAWFRLQRANSFNLSRQWERALADHNEAIAIAGDNQPWHFHFHRGVHWAQRGRWDQAAEDFRFVQDNAPDDYFEGANWWVGRDLVMLFAVTGERDRFERAADRLVANFAQTDNAEIADWIVKACVLGPVNQQRAETLATLEQRSSHLADLQSALKFRAGAVAEADALLGAQNQASACFLRALIKQGRGDVQAALAWFERGQRTTVAEEAVAETRSPFGFWQEWAFAVALRQQARAQLDTRLADLSKALVADPENADLHFARGIVYKALARDAEALADFDKAVARKPELHEAWFQRGQVKEGIGQSEEALSDYSKAIELHADRPDYFVARGDLHTQREAWKEAAEDYSRAITAESEDVALVVKRADAYEKLEQWENAVRDWTRAIELRPNNTEYLNRRARCYSWHLANHEKAIEDWTRLIELRNTDPWFFMERAANYNGLGQWEAAMADYNQAVQIGDANSWWWSYSLRGSQWAQRGEWQKAADDLAQSFPLPPRPWGAWQVAREHALLRMMIGDLQGYRQAIEELQRRSPEEVNVVQLRWLVYVLVLDPEGMDPAGRDRLISLVDQLATGDNAWWAPRLKAAILFRTGEVEAATALFDRNPGGPAFQFLAAMAHDQLGHADRAKELLDASSAWIQQQRDNDPDDIVPKGSFAWQDWVVYLILQRQAEAITNAGNPGTLFPGSGR